MGELITANDCFGGATALFLMVVIVALLIYDHIQARKHEKELVAHSEVLRCCKVRLRLQRNEGDRDQLIVAPSEHGDDDHETHRHGATDPCPFELDAEPSTVEVVDEAVSPDQQLMDMVEGVDNTSDQQHSSQLTQLSNKTETEEDVDD